MEFLKRKHFSLWIILYVNFWAGFVIGLQGVPTWICLGIKSPFIEFRAEIEILSNTSVSLNITKDDQALMHEQGLQKLGTFIKPIDLRNSTTGFVKANLTKKVDFDSQPRRKGVTENPIAEEMNRKNIELIEEEADPSESLINAMNADRKFIVPMALKNPVQEAKKEAPSEFSTNIDDLKNHILMLQNMTKSNKNFQDKFVVFPSIQRERNSSKIAITTPNPRKMNYQQPRMYEHRPHEEPDPEDFPRENIAIIPQVLLLNDQTAPDDDVANANANEDRKDYRVSYARRRNFRRTTSSTTTTTTVRPSRRTPKRQRSGGGEKRKKNRRNQNCRNLDTPRCQRQRRRQQQQQQQLSLTFNSSLSGFTMSGSDSLRSQDRNDFKLSRSIRSHKRRNAGGSMKSGYGSTYETAGGTITRDFIIPVGNVINNNQTIAYKENIDINPDLCYKVDGLTYGQQKLCVLHTNVMPAISRGARSAIQECKHQFKNRRWNCSTTDDNTVFGAMSSIGSPEMAFIHALAAATVTSFIARACRDGQLASCGCSRSSRPKQLHDDWTWGGCGDDLEFAYKMSQSFVDIREKERKRGTRGLITVPLKSKMDEKILAEFGNNTPSTMLESTGNSTQNSTLTLENGGNMTTSINNSNVVESSATHFKPEDLLELNDKITKEILNSKLQEKEMLALKEKISREILNSKVFNLDHSGTIYGGRKQHQRTGSGPLLSSSMGRIKGGGSQKARSLMNLHNNEAGRRAVIKKTRITCKCHGVSGSCSLITCWQQLSSIREIGDYLREKYDEATEVKLNKRGRLQVKDPRYKVPTAHDLVYLDESPDWCRNSRQLQWPGTHGRICNKTSSGLDGCAILCCGRGYNTKNIVVRERCNCKFHWCCQVKCEICVKTLEEHTCK